MITSFFVMACIGSSIAGEGGFVYLINLSGSDWIKTHQYSNKMENWEFPDLVKNGDTELVYVEFSSIVFIHLYFLFKKDFSYALVDYELVGTGGKSFQILANGKQLELVYNNLELDGQPKGKRHNLGWRHDGDTNIIIIRNNGTYTGTKLDGSNWMKNNIDILGSRTLKQISIPGSHDAGMSRLDGSTAFGNDCNVLTQSYSIGDQLKLGIRYFDIRPVIGNGGQYLTGHYSYIDEIGSWQGGNGQSIDSIITDLNVFTNDHNELIIIKLSHSLNTDVGNKSYRKFNQPEWDDLFQKLDKINHRFYFPISDVNLALQLNLNYYTNHGSRASVIIIVDDPDSNVRLDNRIGRGYFMASNLDMYDDYSGSNEWSEMIKDQIKKMHQNSNKQYFLLSWTLTQNEFQAATCTESVRKLADSANNQLGKLLYSEVSASSYPNIILVDNVKHTDVVAMAMAINMKIRL